MKHKLFEQKLQLLAEAPATPPTSSKGATTRAPAAIA
jgi:hypothetical protein